MKEILNVGAPNAVCAAAQRGVQIGGSGIWRISEDDLAAYLERAYQDTQERIASGQIPAGDDVIED